MFSGLKFMLRSRFSYALSGRVAGGRNFRVRTLGSAL